MLGIDHASDRPPLIRRLVSSSNLRLGGVAPVVDVGQHTEAPKDVGRPADVVRVLMGNPQQVDGSWPEIAPELREEMRVVSRAIVALRAARVVARIDDDVAPVGEIDDHG